MGSQQIKEKKKKNNVYMWQVARKLGIHETTFCKWFRDELSQKQEQQILSAMGQILNERKEGQR